MCMCMPVGLECQPQFLWTSDFGFGTWISNLDLELEFGTGLGLDNFLFVLMRDEVLSSHSLLRAHPKHKQ